MMRNLLVALIANGAALAANPVKDAVPLFFIPNLGQALPAVRFMAKCSGLTVCFSPGEALFRVAGRSVRMQFEKANPSPRIEGIERLPGHASFLIGAKKNWRPDVPLYGAVVYRDLYPGIDVVYGGEGQDLKSEFVVAPGAGAFAGTKALWVYANSATANTGWQNMGSWTVTAPAAPLTIVSVSPNGGTGSAETFSYAILAHVRAHGDFTNGVVGVTTLPDAWSFAALVPFAEETAMRLSGGSAIPAAVEVDITVAAGEVGAGVVHQSLKQISGERLVRAESGHQRIRLFIPDILEHIGLICRNGQWNETVSTARISRVALLLPG